MSVTPSQSISSSSVTQMQTSTGDTAYPIVSSEGAQHVEIKGPTEAYGSVTVAERSPVWAIDCTYGPPSGFYVEYTTGATGSTSGEDGAMVLSTGTNAGGFVAARSQLTIRPRASRGVVCDAVAKFSTPVDDNYQLVGPFTAEDGVAIAYDNAQNIAHYQKTGGVREVQTLTISTPASGAETVTVTLNGTGTDVSVTAGTAAENANEIAADTFSGWTSYAIGATVVFVSNSSGALSGSFTVSSTGTLDGTFAETVAGEAGTESFVPQSSWNVDTMDGNGPSRFTLDLTKVFAVRWVLTEFSADFYVRTTLGYMLAHRVTTLNTTDGKLLQNPNLKFQFVTYNAGNTSDIKVYVYTAGMSVSGKLSDFGARRGLSQSKASISTSAELPVISLRNAPTFGSPARVFTGRTLIRSAAIANRGGKGATINLYRGSTLTADSWSLVSANGVLQIDTSATALSGGITLWSRTVAAGSTLEFDLTSLELLIEEGDVFTFGALGTSASNTEITLDLEILEDR